MVVDTHTHIYSPDERRYPPAERLLTLGYAGPPMKGPLRPTGKASLEDLKAEIDANGVDAVCLIQTGTFYKFDNRYVCDSARANSRWTAGVCAFDPDDPHSPGMLASHVRDFGIRGLRSYPANEGRGSLDSPGVKALWKAALDLGVVADVLISWTHPKLGWYWGREHLDGLHSMLDQFPRLPVVLEHCLSMQAGHPDSEPALAALLHLSRHKNLYAKLSFVAAGSRSGYPCEDLHDVCLKIIAAFGPERCVWGSAYPSGLWTPGVSYAQHLRIFTKHLPLKEEARVEILGGTAQRLWFSGWKR
ncbi:MAG: amidohydrolase [Acidobacteria bacterium]|nr:amidohydrolase [Acidobacteriota bacterium]